MIPTYACSFTPLFSQVFLSVNLLSLSFCLGVCFWENLNYHSKRHQIILKRGFFIIWLTYLRIIFRMIFAWPIQPFTFGLTVLGVVPISVFSKWGLYIDSWTSKVINCSAWDFKFFSIFFINFLKVNIPPQEQFSLYPQPPLQNLSSQPQIMDLVCYYLYRFLAVDIDLFFLPCLFGTF